MIIIPPILTGERHNVQEKNFYDTLRSLVSALITSVLLVGCGPSESPPAAMKPPGPDQPLIVALAADPAFLQPATDSEGMNGISRDLVELFANRLGVEVRFVTGTAGTRPADLVAHGKAHMIATVPVQQDDPTVIYSPPLFETAQVIVQHAGALPMDTVEKLAGKEIALLPGALQARVLAAMEIEPPPHTVEHRTTNELELLAGIANFRHELVASDELHFHIATNTNPDLAIALRLPEKIAYGWAFSPARPELLQQAAEFIISIQRDGTLRRLYDRYFGHIKRLDGQDVGAFLDAVQSRLPALRRLFEEAETVSGIDWRLLAALAWQESKWDPLATSPTGVRGIMMLTEETADRLGVKNRLDPRESILAGARYLTMLMEELPDEILPPERLWFALAAYNLGMGHLRGGRQFAAGLQKSPNHWADMKEVLPLLARPEYYSRLKSGRARGGETVIMVENVRSYYDILRRIEPRRSAPLQTGLAMQ